MKYNDIETTKPESKHAGTLYVVATPIGNLEDITLRALRILNDVHLIAAEEPDHTRRLCNHHGIRARLTGYNQHNSKTKGPQLIERLKAGSDIALVTSAGTPAVSDPGSLLINLAHEAGIKVSPVPGPSALITALSACGLKVDRFVFLGFLPNRQGKRRKYLKELLNEQRTMIIYEAPHRIVELLNDMKEIFGDRQAAVLRELTKIHEEIRRGNISEILKGMDEDRVRGEFTVILAGSGKEDGEQDIDLRDRIKALLKAKESGAKEIATMLASEFDISYRAVYRECLNVMKEINP